MSEKPHVDWAAISENIGCAAVLIVLILSVAYCGASQ